MTQHKGNTTFFPSPSHFKPRVRWNRITGEDEEIGSCLLKPPHASIWNYLFIFHSGLVKKKGLTN